MRQEGNLDAQFQQTVAQLTVLAVSQPRAAKLRVQAWLTKLREPTSNVVWKRNRNMYCMLLLAQLQQGSLQAPFTAAPPDGALPNLPNHLVYRALSPSRPSPQPHSRSTSPAAGGAGACRSSGQPEPSGDAAGRHPNLAPKQLHGLVQTFHSNMQARGFDVSRAVPGGPSCRARSAGTGQRLDANMLPESVAAHRTQLTLALHADGTYNDCGQGNEVGGRLAANRAAADVYLAGAKPASSRDRSFLQPLRQQRDQQRAARGGQEEMPYAEDDNAWTDQDVAAAALLAAKEAEIAARVAAKRQQQQQQAEQQQLRAQEEDAAIARQRQRTAQAKAHLDAVILRYNSAREQWASPTGSQPRGGGGADAREDSRGAGAPAWSPTRHTSSDPRVRAPASPGALKLLLRPQDSPSGTAHGWSASGQGQSRPNTAPVSAGEDPAAQLTGNQARGSPSLRLTPPHRIADKPQQSVDRKAASPSRADSFGWSPLQPPTQAFLTRSYDSPTRAAGTQPSGALHVSPRHLGLGQPTVHAGGSPQRASPSPQRGSASRGSSPAASSPPHKKWPSPDPALTYSVARKLRSSPYALRVIAGTSQGPGGAEDGDCSSLLVPRPLVASALHPQGRTCAKFEFSSLIPSLVPTVSGDGAAAAARGPRPPSAEETGTGVAGRSASVQATGQPAVMERQHSFPTGGRNSVQCNLGLLPEGAGIVGRCTSLPAEGAATVEHRPSLSAKEGDVDGRAPGLAAAGTTAARRSASLPVEGMTAAEHRPGLHAGGPGPAGLGRSRVASQPPARLSDEEDSLGADASREELYDGQSPVGSFRLSPDTQQGLSRGQSLVVASDEFESPGSSSGHGGSPRGPLPSRRPLTRVLHPVANAADAGQTAYDSQAPSGTTASGRSSGNLAAPPLALRLTSPPVSPRAVALVATSDTSLERHQHHQRTSSMHTTSVPSDAPSDIPSSSGHRFPSRHTGSRSTERLRRGNPSSTTSWSRPSSVPPSRTPSDPPGPPPNLSAILRRRSSGPAPAAQQTTAATALPDRPRPRVSRHSSHRSSLNGWTGTGSTLSIPSSTQLTEMARRSLAASLPDAPPSTFSDGSGAMSGRGGSSTFTNPSGRGDSSFSNPPSSVAVLTTAPTSQHGRDGSGGGGGGGRSSGRAGSDRTSAGVHAAGSGGPGSIPDSSDSIELQPTVSDRTRQPTVQDTPRLVRRPSTTAASSGRPSLQTDASRRPSSTDLRSGTTSLDPSRIASYFNSRSSSAAPSDAPSLPSPSYAPAVATAAAAAEAAAAALGLGAGRPLPTRRTSGGFSDMSAVEAAAMEIASLDVDAVIREFERSLEDHLEFTLRPTPPRGPEQQQPSHGPSSDAPSTQEPLPQQPSSRGASSLPSSSNASRLADRFALYSALSDFRLAFDRLKRRLALHSSDPAVADALYHGGGRAAAVSLGRYRRHPSPQPGAAGRAPLPAWRPPGVSSRSVSVDSSSFRGPRTVASAPPAPAGGVSRGGRQAAVAERFCRVAAEAVANYQDDVALLLSRVRMVLQPGGGRSLEHARRAVGPGAAQRDVRFRRELEAVAMEAAAATVRELEMRRGLVAEVLQTLEESAHQLGLQLVTLAAAPINLPAPTLAQLGAELRSRRGDSSSGYPSTRLAPSEQPRIDNLSARTTDRTLPSVPITEPPTGSGRSSSNDSRLLSVTPPGGTTVAGSDLLSSVGATAAWDSAEFELQALGGAGITTRRRDDTEWLGDMPTPSGPPEPYGPGLGGGVSSRPTIGPLSRSSLHDPTDDMGSSGVAGWSTGYTRSPAGTDTGAGGRAGAGEAARGRPTLHPSHQQSHPYSGHRPPASFSLPLSSPASAPTSHISSIPSSRMEQPGSAFLSSHVGHDRHEALDAYLGREELAMDDWHAGPLALRLAQEAGAARQAAEAAAREAAAAADRQAAQAEALEAAVTAVQEAANASSRDAAAAASERHAAEAAAHDAAQAAAKEAAQASALEAAALTERQLAQVKARETSALEAAVSAVREAAEASARDAAAAAAERQAAAREAAQVTAYEAAVVAERQAAQEAAREAASERQAAQAAALEAAQVAAEAAARAAAREAAVTAAREAAAAAREAAQGAAMQAALEAARQAASATSREAAVLVAREAAQATAREAAAVAAARKAVEATAREAAAAIAAREAAEEAVREAAAAAERQAALASEREAERMAALEEAVAAAREAAMAARETAQAAAQEAAEASARDAAKAAEREAAQTAALEEAVAAARQAAASIAQEAAAAAEREAAANAAREAAVAAAWEAAQAAQRQAAQAAEREAAAAAALEAAISAAREAAQEAARQAAEAAAREAAAVAERDLAAAAAREAASVAAVRDATEATAREAVAAAAASEAAQVTAREAAAAAERHAAHVAEREAALEATLATARDTVLLTARELVQEAAREAAVVSRETTRAAELLAAQAAEREAAQISVLEAAAATAREAAMVTALEATEAAERHIAEAAAREAAAMAAAASKRAAREVVEEAEAATVRKAAAREVMAANAREAAVAAALEAAAEAAHEAAVATAERRMAQAAAAAAEAASVMAATQTIRTDPAASPMTGASTMQAHPFAFATPSRPLTAPRFVTTPLRSVGHQAAAAGVLTPGPVPAHGAFNYQHVNHPAPHDASVQDSHAPAQHPNQAGPHGLAYHAVIWELPPGSGGGGQVPLAVPAAVAEQMAGSDAAGTAPDDRYAAAAAVAAITAAMHASPAPQAPLPVDPMADRAAWKGLAPGPADLPQTQKALERAPQPQPARGPAPAPAETADRHAPRDQGRVDLLATRTLPTDPAPLPSPAAAAQLDPEPGPAVHTTQREGFLDISSSADLTLEVFRNRRQELAASPPRPRPASAATTPVHAAARQRAPSSAGRAPGRPEEVLSAIKTAAAASAAALLDANARREYHEFLQVKKQLGLIDSLPPPPVAEAPRAASPQRVDPHPASAQRGPGAGAVAGRDEADAAARAPRRTVERGVEVRMTAHEAKEARELTMRLQRLADRTSQLQQRVELMAKPARIKEQTP